MVRERTNNKEDNHSIYAVTMFQHINIILKIFIKEITYAPSFGTVQFVHFLTEASRNIVIYLTFYGQLSYEHCINDLR
jgi:hypothetical protein